MPTIWIPEEELKALQAVFTTAERVNWAAYDRAKQYILHPRSTAVKVSPTVKTITARVLGAFDKL